MRRKHPSWQAWPQDGGGGGGHRRRDTGGPHLVGTRLDEATSKTSRFSTGSTGWINPFNHLP